MMPQPVRPASMPYPPPEHTDRLPGNVPIHGGHPAPAPEGAMTPGMTGPATAATLGAAKDTSETVYTCPMHPEVVSDQPGKCPKCGMKLVPKK